MSIYHVVGVGEHEKYFDESSYQYVINYILDHAIYCGSANLNSISDAAEEMLDVAIAFNKNKGKRVRHSVLSFAAWENVTPCMADIYAKNIISFYADRYQIVYAVHDNTDEVHIHFVMNQVSFVDGYKYGGKRADYHAFINYIRAVTHRCVIPG